MSDSVEVSPLFAPQADGVSIQQVSTRCGIPAVTLRAWERRYGLLSPGRTEKGHRRYSETDMARIQQIQQWLERGVPISQVSGLLAQPETAASARYESSDGPWQEAAVAAMTALESLNTRRLEQLLNGLLNDYSHALVLEQFCDPLRAQLAATPSLGGLLTVLDSVLVAKWSSRALSLAPRRRQAGWLLVPVGGALPALELAMVLNRPLWCLGSNLSAGELRSVFEGLAERGGGVLWVLDRWPTAAERQQVGVASARGLAEACWGMDVSQLPLPAEVSLLTGRRQALLSELDRLQHTWSTT